MSERAVLAVAAALGLAAAVGVGLVVVLDDDPEVACADVGFDGPPAPTPEQALDAFVEHRGGDGTDWRAAGDGDFVPRDAPALLGLERIGVAEVRPGVWQVVGGCVDGTAG